VPHCPLLKCSPLPHRADLSTPAESIPATWCRIVHSCIFHTPVFDRAALSTPANSINPFHLGKLHQRSEDSPAQNVKGQTPLASGADWPTGGKVFLCRMLPLLSDDAFSVVVELSGCLFSLYTQKKELLLQESLAIAKTTAQCAQYMGALKSFESPRKRPWLRFPKFVKCFCSDRY